MNKTRKRIAKDIVLVGLIFGLVMQASASFSSWRTFSLPSNSNPLSNGAIVDADRNGNRVQGTTVALSNAANAITRQARVGSRNQTMWSNPQVRMHRPTTSTLSSWSSSWGSVSNSSHRDIDIPMQNNRTFRVQARSAINQIGTDTAQFRVNVQRSR